MFKDENKVFFYDNGERKEILIKDIKSIDKKDIIKFENGIKIEFHLIVETCKNGTVERVWISEDVKDNDLISLLKEKCARDLVYNRIFKKMQHFNDYNIIHCCDKSCINNEGGYCNQKVVEFTNDLAIDEEYSELIKIPNLKCLDYKKKVLY